MVKCCYIKTLKKEYQNKKIYLWNINRSAGVLWLDLGLKQINIAGFVVYDEDYPEETTLFNRPIVKLSELKNIDDVVLTAESYVTTLDLAKVPQNVKFIYQEDLFDFNEELQEKSVYIYGAGKGAKDLSKELVKHNVNIKGYCTTENEGVEIFNSLTVKKYDKNNFDENDAILIGVIRDEFKREILKKLMDFPGTIYIEDLIDSCWKANTTFHQMLYKTIKDNRRIFLCTGKYASNILLKNFLKTYGFKISGEVCYDDIYSLADGDINDKVVIINEQDKKQLYYIVAVLRKLGFTYDIPNMGGLQLCMEHLKVIGGDHKGVGDALVGCVTSFDGGKEKLWKTIKSSGKSQLKIMIVGGSTSTAELYYPETWMQKLHRKLNNAGLSSTFYVGGIPGGTVVPEFLILLRDAYALKPDIIISFSGVNNTNTRIKDSDLYLNQFNIYNIYRPDLEYTGYIGHPIEEDAFDFWARVEKMIKLYAEHIGVKFFPILQPINLYKPNMTIYDKLQYQIEEHFKGGKLFYEKAKDDDFYINLHKLLINEKDVCFDFAHYTDKGAEIISDALLERILPAAREIVLQKDNHQNS